MDAFAGLALGLFGIGIVGAAFVMTVAIISSEHRILRIKSWWGTIQNMVLSFLPDSVANVLRVADAPEPYQISHSLNAIKHGEFLARGLVLGYLSLAF